MRYVTGILVVFALMASASPFVSKGCAQSSLALTYGSDGLDQITYKGTVLEDTKQFPADALHIWHMKATDLSGNPVTQGQYGWGENNSGRSWNAAAHSWTYSYVWGSIVISFAQIGDTLTVTETTSNASNSGIIFDGASIYPFGLHFPQLPGSFGNGSTQQISDNLSAPGIVLADYRAGEVAAVTAGATRALYSGFLPSGATRAYSTLLSTTSPDGLAVFLPHVDRPILPGHSDTATVSFRFAASGTPLSSLAADIYRGWAAAWPPQLKWADHRIIGTIYLASSPQGNPMTPAGYPNNPRRYFNDSNASDFDIRTQAGLQAFQAKILQQAQSAVQNLQRLGAQGAITWDIEGEQYPQATSYACSPDQIAALAPEMESTVEGQNSPYNGMKLDDAYFRTLKDAGFRIGVCVRPQHFTLASNGTAQQVYLPDTSVAAELLAKMRYAHDRWGATMFYVDTSVETDGAVLSPDIFAQLGSALPDSLIIPEESTPKHYAYAAPLLSFLFHTDLGTDPSIANYYPTAFSLNLINDVDPGKLATYAPQLTDSVRRGDILMVHADYWQANNPTVMQIYQAASSGK